MADEMITTEYAGTGRMNGTHHVRVFWRVTRDQSTTLAKRAAAACVRAELKPAKGTRVSFVSMDLDTYKSPHLAAIMVYRLRTAEEIAHRAELAKHTYTRCDGCADNEPGQLVLMLTGESSDVRVEPSHTYEGGGTVWRVTFGPVPTGEERALCFSCWHPIRSTCKVLHWIDRRGKLQLD